jgi:hypothetical protein
MVAYGHDKSYLVKGVRDGKGNEVVSDLSDLVLPAGILHPFTAAGLPNRKDHLRYLVIHLPILDHLLPSEMDPKPIYT